MKFVRSRFIKIYLVCSMFGVGLYVYQRGFFPRKTPRWLLNIVQTWHKPYKLGSNCVHILAKPKLAGLSDTNRPNLTKFGQTRYEPGANLSRPGAAPARSPPPPPCCSGGLRLPPNEAWLLVLRTLVFQDRHWRNLKLASGTAARGAAAAGIPSTRVGSMIMKAIMASHETPCQWQRQSSGAGRAAAQRLWLH